MVVVNRCWLCETEGESVDHLLFHCVAASALWNAFFAWFYLCWVMSRSVKELFASWWSGGLTRSIVVRKMVPHCIMWCIWRGRNNRCFEDLARSRESSYISFFLLFTPGQWAGLPRGVLAFQIFFLTSLPPPSSPCILPVYQGLRLSALLIFYSIGLSKKEKKKCFAGYML
jgi:hypothetical protein